MVVALLAVGASTLFPIADGDVWWHIAIGRWLLAHGAMPTGLDPFAWTASGACRIYEPISDVTFAVIWDAGGVAGLYLLKIVAVGALLWALHRAWISPSVHAHSAVRATLVALLGAGIHVELVERPYLLSFALCGVVVWQAPALAAARRSVFALPLFATVAINVHRSGVMLTGIAVAVTLAGLLARSRFAQRRRRTTANFDGIDSGPPLSGVVVIAAAALACGALLLNPAGAFGVLSTVPGVGGWQADLTLVEEWRQLTLASLLVDTPTAAVLFALAAWTAVRRTSSPAHLLVFLLALPFALRARFLPYALIASTPLAAAALEHLLTRAGTLLRARRAAPPPAALVNALLAAALLAVVVTQHTRDLGDQAFRIGLAPRVPMGAGEFLRSHRVARVWNDYNFGGYLLFAAGPDTQVSVDGRTGNTIYPPGFAASAIRAADEPAILAALLRAHPVDVLVTRFDGFADALYVDVERDPQLLLAYWDDVSAVLVRDATDAARHLAPYRELRVDTALARVAAIRTDARQAQLLAELERNAVEQPNSARAAWLLARAYLKLDRVADANAQWSRAQQVAASNGFTLPQP